MLASALSASADPVEATGFGPTASAAIANAAVNGVRDVAGSRITVTQDLSTETFGGVPDEVFVEKMLEASRGTVKRLKVVSVEKVGELFQAKVQIDVDPGKLEVQSSPKAGLALRPGELAGGVAGATLRSNAKNQLQDAFNDFISPSARVVTVSAVSVEDHETILRELRKAGRFDEGMVPIRIVVKVSTDPNILAEMEAALRSGSDEIPLSKRMNKNSAGTYDADYSCGRDPRANAASMTAVILKPTKEPPVSGDIGCGWITEKYRSEITGVPSTAFAADSKLDPSSLASPSVFELNLVGGSGDRNSYSVSWRDNTRLPFDDGGIVVAYPRSDEFYSVPIFINFSPSALVASKGQNSKAWVFLQEVSLSFTVPVSPEIAENVSTVEVAISRQ